MTVSQIVVLVLLEALSVGFIIVMWRHHTPDRLRKDLLWTFLLLLPLFGPMMWGAFYGALPSHGKPRQGGPAGGRAPRRRDL